ncbi:MAG: deoxyguanosinetriphosphate triphosphohydrolase [Clostridiaceae bacterium]|nr:deoxyguanosinetriphosphate triphosphohydrolase [Clostridiaceae bacterium]
MTVRERLEQEELLRLSPFASFSVNSKRAHPLSPCPLRTNFQRDRDRIIHCKSFRRLKYKTQVFLDPLGDHFRTRLTHTLEVTQVARTLARSLRLNEDLAEAIGLGHDLGHTPFGHIGERMLNELMTEGFSHNLQSLRIVEVLENGEGLNLTQEVRDGLCHHRGSVSASTLEGQCVSYADRIAYLNHDIDDAIRAGVLRQEELPKECVSRLGDTSGKRINTMIVDIITQSQGTQSIQMSPEVKELSDSLRQFMFEHVYSQGWRDREEQKCDHVIERLFHYYMAHPGEMPLENITTAYQEGHERAVGDYIAGMTDRYAIHQFQTLFVPKAFASY